MMSKIRKIFNSKSTIMIITPVLMLILLFAATGAWYVLSRDTAVEVFNGTMSQWDFVISTTPGGEPITENDVLELEFTKFANVTSDTLAPGTYGTIEFYIRTTTAVTTDYLIYIDKAALRLDVASENAITPEDIQAEKDANSLMLQKHFKFYADKEMTQEIDSLNPMRGSLSPNSEVKATIYWCWVYDGRNSIPDNITNDTDKLAFLQAWDLEDCFISDNREYASGKIGISVTASQQVPELETIAPQMPGNLSDLPQFSPQMPERFPIETQTHE